jgi:hypothetical protein
MKLYVCYGTFKFAPRPGGHPCGNAYHALVDAGYKPDVIRSYGWAALPEAFNQTAGRREVKRLTGNSWVPALVTDDGEVIQGSDKIIAWAKPGASGPGAGEAGAGAGTPADAPAAGAPDSPAS